MSWIGAGIGAFLGSARGGGILGGIIGAVVGNWVEEKARSALGKSPSKNASKNELETLAAISAMLSKMAKADGRISEDEVHYCEAVFDRLGLAGEKREYCIRVFRTAKNDIYTIYSYADSFASMQQNIHVREIVYGVLWDLACIDGDVSSSELEILRNLVVHLKINSAIFIWECRRRGIYHNEQAAQQAESDPYEILGCSRKSSDEELKKAYREKAKQFHPDTLRAQGLPEEIIAKANDQMARVNAAWSSIKRERFT
jgi:DnaJ like chaperone protein